MAGGLGPQVAELVAADRPGDAVAYWLTDVVGMPAEMVSGMRYPPFWAGTEAEAHGLIADYALIGDGRFDKGALRTVPTPTLVMDGGSASAPPMANAAAAVVATLPQAIYQALEGQPHNVADDVMAAALVNYFR